LNYARSSGKHPLIKWHRTASGIKNAHISICPSALEGLECKALAVIYFVYISEA
jgi:hypothetical protein